MPVEKDTSGSTKPNVENGVPTEGERLICETCGLSVIIDEVSGSITFEEPVCCGKPMKLKPSPLKKALVSKTTRGRQAGSSRYQG